MGQRGQDWTRDIGIRLLLSVEIITFIFGERLSLSKVAMDRKGIGWKTEQEWVIRLSPLSFCTHFLSPLLHWCGRCSLLSQLWLIILKGNEDGCRGVTTYKPLCAGHDTCSLHLHPHACIWQDNPQHWFCVQLSDHPGQSHGYLDLITFVISRVYNEGNIFVVYDQNGII